jgi:hypothetical protein
MSSRALALAALAVFAAAAPAAGQTSLGGQRVGTSSGTFLKIIPDARGAAMGDAIVAVVEGAAATFRNPAGLAAIGGHQVLLSHIDWPADVDYDVLAYAQALPSLDVIYGVHLGVLHTTLDETSESRPQGTGRQFSFNDWVGGVSAARRFTDKLWIGATAKYVREEMGTEVGGPVSHALLFDAGTVYHLGWANSRMAVALLNFGPELTPSGQYESHIPGKGLTDYQSASPPTTYRLGLKLEPWRTERALLVTSFEMNHLADNEETARAGGEIRLYDRLALRAGYDFNADALRFSTGIGVNAEILGGFGTADYAFTEGGYLGSVHRISLGLEF